MVSIAVVEDDEKQIEQTERYIRDFGKETGQTFNVTVFRDGLALLDRYKPIYDIVFMDIEMPDLNGLDTAKKLRELDSAVIIMFMTNMQQYAIRGYEVEALDYMVKPVGYFTFALKLKKAIKKLGRSAEAFHTILTRDLPNDADLLAAAREACHRMLYTAVNSAVMNGISASSRVVSVTPWWQILLVTLDIVLGVFAIAGAVMLVLTIMKQKKAA